MLATARLLSGKEQSQDCVAESAIERLHMVRMIFAVVKCHELGM